MAREIDLLGYWMPVLRQLKEFKEIAKAETPELKYILEQIERTLNNMFIETADECGIKRFEDMIGIYPEAGASLETRRFNVLVKWNDKVPYTEKELYNRLISICGDDNFSVNPDYKNYFLEIITHLGIEGAFDTISSILQDMIPCNLVLDLKNTLEEGNTTPFSVAVVSCVAMRYQITNDINPKVATESPMYYGVGLGRAGEELLDMLLDYIRSGKIGLAVLDSAPFIIPKAVQEKGLDEKSYGGNSALMKAFCDKAVPLCKKVECTFLMINQLRENIGNPYKPYKIPCGTAIAHACSQILWFTKGSLLDEKYKEVSSGYANPSGNLVSVKVEKNKVTKNDRRLQTYTLNYSTGVDTYLCISCTFYHINAVYKDLENDAEKKVLIKAISRLSGREQMIIRMRFGLGTADGEEKTQKEVADMLGISQSYISRLEKKIMQRLRREMVKYS